MLNVTLWCNLSWCSSCMLELSQIESEQESWHYEEEEEYSEYNNYSHVVFLFAYLSRGSCKKLDHMSISDSLNISEVSSFFNFLTCCPWKLSVSVGIEMFLFNWVNSLDNVPVDSSSAWWSGHWTFVNPTIVGINGIQKLSVKDIGLWIISFIVTKRIEEIINDCNLSCCNAFIVIFGIENNTNGSSNETIIWSSICNLWWVMNCMQFQIKLLAVNLMLRLRMDVESLCLKPLRSLENRISKFGFEVSFWPLCACLFTSIQINLNIVRWFISFPFDFSIFEIDVVLDECLLGVCIYLFNWCRKVDGTLSSRFAFSILFRPVVTICFVINSGWLDWCKEGHGHEFHCPHFF